MIISGNLVSPLVEVGMKKVLIDGFGCLLIPRHSGVIEKRGYSVFADNFCQLGPKLRGGVS